MADLEQPTGGTFTINGVTPAAARYLRLRLCASGRGFVPFAHHCTEQSTVVGEYGDHLARAGRAGGTGAGTDGVEQVEKKFPAVAGRGAAAGLIARMLGFDADILLMDEPSGALGEIVRDHLNEQLFQLWGRTEKTISFVAHAIPRRCI